MHPGFPLAALMLALMLALPFAAAEEKTADYGEGLKQLAALGLPAMTEAEWVRKPKDFPGESFPESYEFRELGVRLQGGMWKLPGEPPRLLGFGTPEVTSSEPEAEEAPGKEEAAKSPGLLEKMLRNHSAKNPPKKAEAKPGLNVEDDAKSVVEALGKENIPEWIQQRMEYGRTEVPARCLIFAAQLHAAGKPEAANRLANAIFATAVDKAALIDAAVSHFANLEQAKATETFFKDRDWKKYHEAMKALLAKYPRGWDHAGAVAMLMPGLEKRAAGVTPPAPSLPGIELKPEALAALENMLQPPQGATPSDEDLAASHGIDLSEIPAQHRGRYLAMLRQQGIPGMRGGGRGGLWLLEKPETPAGDGDPAGQLKAMGMDGLIALAAVASDDTLVPFANQGDGSSSYYGSSRSAEELAADKFESMARPKTRGERAVELLKSSIPLGEDDADEMDDVSVAEAAIAFWTAHRGKSGMDLALLFLSEGDYGQKSEAATYLANHDDPKAQEAFEKAVLGSDGPAEYREQVEAYLEKKKAAAKPFFEAYAKVLKESLDGVGDDDLDYTIKQAGGVEKYLKTLSMKVGATSLDELVAIAMKSGKNAEIAALANTIGTTSMQDCLKVLGKAAEKATPQQVMELYQVLLRRAYYDREDMEEAEDAGEEAAPAKPDIPEEIIALWRPLIARTEILPESKSAQRYLSNWTKGYGGKTCGDAALLTLELCAVPGSREALNPYADIHGGGEAVMPFARTRVEAWMSGREAPAWPNADKVSEERKKEITDKLAQLPADEVISYAQGLPDEERIALTEIVHGYDPDDEAPAGLVELKKKVIALRPANLLSKHDPALLEKLGIREGMILSAEMLRALAQKLVVGAKENSGTLVVFSPAPMGLGCVATASRADDPQAQRYTETYTSAVSRSFQIYENPEALSMLFVRGATEHWALQDGKAEKLESKSPIEQDLQAILAMKTAVLSPVMIQVMTREDAEKFNHQQTEEPEEEE